MPQATVAGRRNVAAVVAILTGVILLALAIWPGDPTASAGAQQEFTAPNWAWMAHGIAGLLAIGAVFVSQRADWRGLARIMLAVGGIALIAALLVVRDFGLRSLVTLLLPAVALLATVPALGPLPPPQQD